MDDVARRRQRPVYRRAAVVAVPVSPALVPRASDGAPPDGAGPAPAFDTATVRRTVWPAFAVGLALFTGLLAWHGVAEVGRALAVAGAGLLLLPLVHLVPLTADAIGWRRLLHERPGVGTMVFARWVGESVNGLLPALQIGGNVAKARLLASRGVPGITAGASVVVDVTLVMLTQMAFTLVGLTLLVGRLGGERLLPAALVGLGLMAMLLVGFVWAQRAGLFAAAARALGALGRRGPGTALLGGADALDAAVRRLHDDRRALVTAGIWHAASWLLGVAEVLVALALLGHPVDPWTAVLLESLGQAVRAAAFVVPGALGVQEGGYLLLGATVGLAPDTALALSLSRRVRDLLLGLPGLVAWQWDAARAPARRRQEGR